jgi:Uma2 family endonuclease
MLTKVPPAKKRPTYEIVELFPAQGDWAEEEYLKVAGETNHLVEFSDGKVEVLDMPSLWHQEILGRLFFALSLYLRLHKLGKVYFSALPVRLWAGKFREPDLIFISQARLEKMPDDYLGLPDLVAEIISESNEEHDRVTKMSEYARAGIREYWIVDPQANTVEVYWLKGNRYTLNSQLKEGDTLISFQLPGFELSLAELFAPQ